MTDTIGTKSGTADMPVVVVAAQDRIVTLLGYPAEQGNPHVTCPSRVTQMCVAEIPGGGFPRQLFTGYFYRGHALKL